MTTYDQTAVVTVGHGGPTVLVHPGEWLARLLTVTGSGTLDHGRTYQCPAHPDEAPSLSLVGARGEPRRFPRCFAGCTVASIAHALRIPTAYLLRPPDVDPVRYAATRNIVIAYPAVQAPGGPGSAGLRLDAIHLYGDAFRLLRYRHPVTGKKAIEWERHDGRSWIPGLGGTPTKALPLYRETEARMAVGAGELLVVVESESSADAICSAGIYATTWAGGASTPNLPLLARLRDHRALVLCPDNDPPGLTCAQQVQGVLPNARLLLPPPGQDARDLLTTAGPRVFTELQAAEDPA